MKTNLKFEDNVKRGNPSYDISGYLSSLVSKYHAAMFFRVFFMNAHA